MRIVGGKYKGRMFHPGKSFRSRPTTDFAKEGLFNVLENRIDWEETDVLDLFAGTGSISFEFASRGCRSVTCVEKDFVHCRFISSVASELKIDRFEVVREDAFRFLLRCSRTWPLVFADPPFTMAEFQSVAATIMNSGVLEPDGVLIVEHSGNIDFSGVPGFFELRKYGHVHFSFFRNFS